MGSPTVRTETPIYVLIWTGRAACYVDTRMRTGTTRGGGDAEQENDSVNYVGTITTVGVFWRWRRRRRWRGVRLLHYIHDHDLTCCGFG